MKSVLFVLLVVVTGWSTEAQKKKELTTLVNVNYCLPEVVYEVEVTLECTRFVPGPYRDYAIRELGVRPEIMEAHEEWSIEHINVNSLYIPDEKTVYSVSATGDYSPLVLTFSAEGFLAGVATGEGGVYHKEGEIEYVRDNLPEGKVIDIMKLNTYNPLKEVLDTNYTYQEVDGVMKKIWDPIVRYASKTEEDNVKEAVSEIFRIRSERVKLLGAENNVADGKSLEIILREFDRMEENYLSLFMGKKETGRLKRVFECIPQKAEEPVVVFRFTSGEGFADLKNVSAPAYMLKCTKMVVPASNPVAGEATGAAIYYRVPAVGELKLIHGKEELMSFRTIVPQLGEIKKFPVDVISSEGLMLEFYPHYGALKSIKRK